MISMSDMPVRPSPANCAGDCIFIGSRTKERSRWRGSQPLQAGRAGILQISYRLHIRYCESPWFCTVDEVSWRDVALAGSAGFLPRFSCFIEAPAQAFHIQEQPHCSFNCHPSCPKPKKALMPVQRPSTVSLPPQKTTPNHQSPTSIALQIMNLPTPGSARFYLPQPWIKWRPNSTWAIMSLTERRGRRVLKQ